MRQEPFKPFEVSVFSETSNFTLDPGSFFALQNLQMNRAGNGYWWPFGGLTCGILRLAPSLAEGAGAK